MSARAWVVSALKSARCHGQCQRPSTKKATTMHRVSEEHVQTQVRPRARARGFVHFLESFSLLDLTHCQGLSLARLALLLLLLIPWAS